MNYGTVVGNLTADPIMRETSDGTKVLNFSIADNRQFTNRAGDTIEEVSFHDIVVWRLLAEHANATLKKGMRVIATGRWEQSNFEVEVNGETVKRSKHRLIAQAVGPDLLFATAEVTKQTPARQPEQVAQVTLEGESIPV